MRLSTRKEHAMWTKKQLDISHLATKTEVELVRAEIQTLRAELTATRAEAAELYDKAYHMHARTAKRLRDAQRDDQIEVDLPPAPEVDEVTAKILERRRMRAIPSKRSG